MRVRLKRIVHLCGRLMLIMGLLMIVVYIALQTPRGRGWLAHELSRALSHDSLTIQLEGLSGHIPLAARLESLVLSDADGPWLRIDKLDWSVSAIALLQGRLQLHRLSAARVAVLRRPGPAAPPPVPSEPHGLPASLPPISVSRLSLRQLHLDSTIVGTPLTVRAVGSVTVGEGRDRLEAHLDLDGDLAAAAQLQASVRAPQTGWIDWLLRLNLVRLRSPWFSADRLDARYRLRAHGETQAGNVVISMLKEGHQLDARGDYASGPGKHSFSNMVVSAPGLSFTGGVDVDAAFRQFDGAVDLVVSNSGSLAAITGYAYSGEGQLQVSACSTGGQQAVQAVVAFHDVQGPALGVTNIEVRADISDLYGRPRGVVELGAQHVRWKELYVGEADLQLRGDDEQVDIDAAIDGHWATDYSVSATGRLHYGDEAWGLTLALPSAKVGAWGASVQLIGALKTNHVEATADVTFVEAGRLHVEAGLPIGRDGGWHMPSHRLDEVRVAIKPDVSLAFLSALPVFANGFIAGRITGDLVYRGWGQDAQLTGACRLEDGWLESFELGTVIRELNGVALAEGRRLRLQDCAATDGGEGVLALTGQLDLTDPVSPVLNAGLNLTRFRAIDQPAVQALVSGVLTATGVVTRLGTTGDFRIDEGRVDLDNLPPTLPPVLVDSSLVSPVESEAPGRAPRPGALSLTVETAAPLQVAGSSLDSRWDGRVSLASRPEHWDLRGALEARSISFTFLGRRFRLERGGIRFDGSWPAVPVLDLVMVHTRADLTARLSITGRADNPQLAVTSTPSLPQDEILAHILFGQNLAQLSALQLLEIAAAAQSIRTGRSLDFMQRARDALGVDRLELRESDGRADDSESGAVLAVGKHLGEGFYTEINRPMSADGKTRVTLEYQVNPNFSVETEAGMNMSPGFGLNWRRDY